MSQSRNPAALWRHLIDMGRSRGTIVLVGLVVGCGPRVILDEDEGSADGSEGDASSGSPPSATETGDESGAPQPDPVTTGGDESSGNGGADPLGLCPEIEAESAYCITFSMERTYLVGADSGATCELPQLDYGAYSMAWIGDDLLMCAGGGVSRVNIIDGEVTTGGAGCEGVAAINEGLIVVPGMSLGESSVYASFDAVLAGTPSRTFTIHPWASRFTGSGDNLYGAWHSTSTIEVWDLIALSQSPSISLEGHDGWVDGISVVDQRLFMVTSDPDNLLIEFDAATGVRVAEHVLDIWLPYGLACRRRG